MPRKYFPFYFTFRETAQTMPPKLRATFYEAIIEYGTTGKEPTLPSHIMMLEQMAADRLKMILLVFLTPKPMVYIRRRRKKRITRR